MFRRLLTATGLKVASASSAAAEPPYAPYRNGAANEIYNLLFCDEPSAFKPQAGRSPAAWQEVLFAEPAETSALSTLAGDAAQEGRVRYLAYARLRQLGETVSPKRLLGVITEVPLDGGLDVLAAYSEGGVRYINQTGQIAVFEGVPSLQPYVQGVLAASEPVIARIGPWNEPRRPPPQTGTVRLTFLVSDGPYFGEGPWSAMHGDVMAGPVIQRATDLLQTVVRMAAK
jgi:hypothetical protein